MSCSLEKYGWFKGLLVWHEREVSVFLPPESADNLPRLPPPPYILICKLWTYPHIPAVWDLEVEGRESEQFPRMARNTCEKVDFKHVFVISVFVDFKNAYKF